MPRIPSPNSVQKAWQHRIYDSDSQQTSVASLFGTCANDDKRVLVIFIRHFFCGNCQEYLRRLSSLLAPDLLPSDLKIVIIGCGSPTFIKSYRKLTNCPDQWPIYADPSTKLYKILGMQRSLSLGPRDPEYIQHSLAAGMMKSIAQAMKRIPEGDILAAGGWSVNGGEYLFQRVEGTKDAADHASWEVTWCHQMQNSRDHTEVEELRLRLALDGSANGDTSDQSEVSEIMNEKTAAATQPKSFRRSMSLRRHSFMQKAGQLGRSSSLLRRSVVL